MYKEDTVDGAIGQVLPWRLELGNICDCSLSVGQEPYMISSVCLLETQLTIPNKDSTSQRQAVVCMCDTLR